MRALRLQATRQLKRAAGRRATLRTLTALPQSRRLAPTWGSETTCQSVRGARAGVANEPSSSLRTLPAKLNAYDVGYLRVSELHTLRYEQYGNPNGVPVVVVHGGPGGACFPRHARYFDIKYFRVILFDQRGCGQSTPAACLIDNNTQALVADIDAIRSHLRIDAMLLFGGSWGVTLALAYSVAHPQRVLGLILRGVCLMRRAEIDWVFRGGCRMLVPRAWEAFTAGMTDAELRDPLAAYYARLSAADAEVQHDAARRFMGLEMALHFPTMDALQVWNGTEWIRRDVADGNLPGAPLPLRVDSSGSRRDVALMQCDTAPRIAFEGGAAHARIAQPLLTCHYSLHDGFLAPGELLDQVHKLRHIPAIVVQGRNDMVCPIQTTWDLHRAWPELEVQVVPKAGHSMYDPGMVHCLMGAAQRMQLVMSQAN